MRSYGQGTRASGLVGKSGFFEGMYQENNDFIGEHFRIKKNSNQFVHRILFLTSAIKQTVTQADGVHHFTVFLNKK